MVEDSGWVAMTKQNPGHSAWYIERFKAMAAEGKDLAGEARFIDAMTSRGSRILDAGCGPGRVSAFLADLGHDVVGVDVDPELIAAAQLAHSGPRWIVSDLAELNVGSNGQKAEFDIIFTAGNVMPFLAPSTRRMVLNGFVEHLVEGGRAVVGFGAGRNYEFASFFDDAESVGLTPELKLSSWDLRPLTDESDFLVAVLSASAP